jgi:Starch binding domain
MGTSMSLHVEQLIDALRLRYDYYSARTMFEIALARAGLPELQAYDPTQVRAFQAALASVGDRLAAVDAQLDGWLAAASAPASPGERPTAILPPTAHRSTAPSPSPANVPAAPGESIEADVRAEVSAPAVVRLSLTGLDVAAGAQVLVCGGTPALGDWDAEHAIPMAQTDEVWLASIAVAPGTALNFKFLQRLSDGGIVWERGENRTVLAAPQLDCKWRSPFDREA